MTFVNLMKVVNFRCNITVYNLLKVMNTYIVLLVLREYIFIELCCSMLINNVINIYENRLLF